MAPGPVQRFPALAQPEWPTAARLGRIRVASEHRPSAHRLRSATPRAILGTRRAPRALPPSVAARTLLPQRGVRACSTNPGQPRAGSGGGGPTETGSDGDSARSDPPSPIACSARHRPRAAPPPGPRAMGAPWRSCAAQRDSAAPHPRGPVRGRGPRVGRGSCVPELEPQGATRLGLGGSRGRPRAGRLSSAIWDSGSGHADVDVTA